MSDIVEHEAFVREIGKDYVIVDVLAKSACISCQLKGVCSVADIEQKAVKVPIDNPNQYNTDDKVTVYMSEKQALNAVWIGYVLPLILVVAILFVLIGIGTEEGIAALIALSVLIPYYFLLYFFRKKFSNKFEFKIKEKIFGV